MPSCEPATADCRCTCGSLLARLVGDRVELKCRRCKRTQLVPLVPAGAFEATRRGVPAASGASPAPAHGARR